MSNRIKQLKIEEETDTISVSDALELTHLHRQVGENTSDIKRLKDQTKAQDGVKMEVQEIKFKQYSIDDRLKKLDKNDTKIETGVINFRYWLFGCVVLIFGCIFGTLKFGLEYSKDNQNDLKAHLEMRMSLRDKVNEKRYDNINTKIDKMTDIIIDIKDK